jgi:rSAM/selenodomain-associated transferase 1
MNDGKALVIFARMPRPGEVKTRLGQALGMERAAELYKSFAEHAFTIGRTMREKGSAVYVSYNPGAHREDMIAWVGREVHLVPQEGKTLGDRMHNAFDITFSEGSARTVIIGTDVPELNVQTIEQAFHTLDSNDVVLGPSTDGGYYLIGMKPPTKEVFEGIRWSSADVFSGTLLHIHRLNLSLAQLPVLADIDTMQDYEAYLRRIGTTQ